MASKARRAAPPANMREAREVVRREMQQIFDMAHELTGTHAPWEMDPEREMIEKTAALVFAAFNALPSVTLIALGRKLHALAENRDFESSQLERDYKAGT